MGFFDSLRQTLGGDSAQAAANRNLAKVYNLANAEGDDQPTVVPQAEPFAGSEYDRKNWRKKLKRILEELPASRAEWPDHIADAHSLGIEPETIRAWSLDEFTMLVRRAVSDRVVTEAEHRDLDLARDLLDIPDPDAEQVLRDVVAEAQTFFGGLVEGA